MAECRCVPEFVANSRAVRKARSDFMQVFGVGRISTTWESPVAQPPASDTAIPQAVTIVSESSRKWKRTASRWMLPEYFSFSEGRFFGPRLGLISLVPLLIEHGR